MWCWHVHNSTCRHDCECLSAEDRNGKRHNASPQFQDECRVCSGLVHIHTYLHTYLHHLHQPGSLRKKVTRTSFFFFFTFFPRSNFFRQPGCSRLFPSCRHFLFRVEFVYSRNNLLLLFLSQEDKNDKNDIIRHDRICV